MSSDPINDKVTVFSAEQLKKTTLKSEDLDLVQFGPVRAGVEENDADKPSHEEVAEQIRKIEESDEGDNGPKGPNETLKRHIEMYSYYSPVFASVGYTLIGAIFVPAMLYFVIYQLSPAYELSDLQGALHKGLSSIVLPLFFASALSRAMVPKGLARKRLGWSDMLCRALKATLLTVLYIVLPLRLVYVVFETYKDGVWHDSLGRAAFILALVAFAAGLHCSQRRLKKWFAETEEERPWYQPFRSLFLHAVPMVPIALAVMAAMGYYFTAEELSRRAIATVLSMVSIALAGGLFSRLLLIAQFQIKLRELTRNEDGQINSDESIDIGEITGQLNQLIRATALVGVVLVGWQIWGTVLPAIDYLREVKLWDGIPNEVGGVTPVISLRELMMAVGCLVLTFVLSTNLPGLLEVTLLDRMRLDRGGRYAVAFVVRYLVLVIGIFFACQLVGFSWNRVQWLAAGLTVGLGFGLQEIFANLVSGIIILIERPIRVGDVVTVSNTTGTVTKMALRATTILDHDYRELIVPNKKFITEDVMNWTLSDHKSRLVVKVGVAYGSDTTLVQNTLMSVASRHPLVVREPEPRAAFCGFGNSTLDFELRVVIPTREMFFKVTHELHMAIDEAFRQKGIEIAFPQQDLNIKNLKDLANLQSPKVAAA
ncbi:mechanosensitive ion channel [Mariniblastus sp.]|nr:mechanosensitive ion channel [Mariniblastus sp.]